MRTAMDAGDSTYVAAPGGAGAWWHGSSSATGAVIAVGGAGNDPAGPSHLYPVLASRLNDAGLGMMRLEYRHAGHLPTCTQDVMAAIAYATSRGVRRIALLGWSFGGAVVISAGAASIAVVGVATVASQTYGAGAVSRLAPRSLLLVHGTADQVLPPVLSERLYASAGEPRHLVLYEGDDHAISAHRNDLVDLLAGWAGTLIA